MLTMLLSTIGSLLGITGWFVKKSIILLLIGFALTLVETVTEWKNYNTGAKNMFCHPFYYRGCYRNIYKNTFLGRRTAVFNDL